MRSKLSVSLLINSLRSSKNNVFYFLYDKLIQYSNYQVLFKKTEPLNAFKPIISIIKKFPTEILGSGVIFRGFVVMDFPFMLLLLYIYLFSPK